MSTVLRNEEKMKIGLMIMGVLVLLAVVILGSVIGVRNPLVKERESVNGAWSQVDVALQRRADLIPNLVATVQGFAKQEQAVIKEVTDARAALGGARNPQEKIDTNSRLNGALRRCVVVARNYPQLKSNDNLLTLQLDQPST